MWGVRAVIVGAGITGLLVARRLQQAGFEVIVHEASDRIGGQIHTIEVEGHPVDVGAEAMHLGAPAVKKLVTELDLSDRIVPANDGGSLLLTRKGLRPLPAGVGPTGPTKIWPVVRSGIMTLPGMARAGLEPLLARLRKSPEDQSVGSFIRGRFGNEVADLFVDPLLGNLHSGDVDKLSLHSTAPQLIGKAAEGTSLLPKPKRPTRANLLGTKPTKPAGPNLFSSLPTGLHELVDAVAEGLDIRLNSPVTSVEATDGRWVVQTAQGPEQADALVLACPAGVAAKLLDPIAPDASRELAQTTTASVATLVLAYDRSRPNQLLDEANGLLLPSTSGRLVKALTNLSRKWPQVADPERHIVRVSVGRAGQQRLATLTDERLVDIVAGELHDIAGLPERPTSSRVIRWQEALPQLEVGHAARLRSVRKMLDALPPIALAGGPYDGLGIGSTVKSAEARAAELIARLTPASQEEAEEKP